MKILRLCWQNSLFLQLARKEIDENRQNDSEHAVFPSTADEGIDCCGNTADEGEKRLFGAFLSIGKCLVINACHFFKTICADDSLIAAFTFVDESGFFISTNILP